MSSSFDYRLFFAASAFAYAFLLYPGTLANSQEPAKIAYVSGSNPTDIVVMNSDGTGGQSMGVSSFSPNRVALSPNAEWLAFAGALNDQTGLFVMRVNAQGPANLPLMVNNDYWNLTTIAWHPGGKHLAWVASDDQSYPQIFLGEVIDGTGAITPVGPSNPAIALTQRGQNFFYSEDPAFSPDGKWMATVRASSIALLKIRNDAGDITPESPTNPVTWVSNRVAEGLFPLWPSWSPNGRDLVFGQKRQPAGADDEYALVSLSVLFAGGIPTPENAGNPRRVLIAPTSHPTDYPVAFPSWSPDGTLIAFQSLKMATAPWGPYAAFEIATLLASAPESPSNLRQIVAPLSGGGGEYPTFSVSAAAFGPLEEPTWQDDIETAHPPMTGRNWRFHARNESRPDHPGMIAKIQYSPTPGDPGSWIDLPGGDMNTSGSVRFLLDTNNIPVGSFAFRIATTVPGLGTSYSDPTEIYQIEAARPFFETEVDVRSDSDPSGATTHRGDLLTYTLRFRNSGASAVGSSRVRVRFPNNTVTRFPAHVEPVVGGTSTGGSKVAAGEYFVWEWPVSALTPLSDYQSISVSFVKRTIPPRKKGGKSTTVTDTYFTAPNSLEAKHGLDIGEIVRVRSSGVLPTGLSVGVNYFVINASSTRFQLATSAGGTPISVASYGSGNLEIRRSAEWQTRSVTFRVVDPTPSVEQAQANAGLPPINAEGGILVSRGQIVEGSVGSSILESADSDPTALVNPLRLSIERVGGDGDVEQGGMVSFDLTVRNESSLTMRDSRIVVRVPEGLAIQGSGDHPVFIGADGQPGGPPVDPITKSQVVKPAGWMSNPRIEEVEIPQNGGFPNFEQQAQFFFGNLLPGQSQEVRVTCRVQYDWDTVANPVIAFQHAEVSAILNAVGHSRLAENGISLDVVDAPSESGKPVFAMWVRQDATGLLPDDSSVAAVASVTGLASVPQVSGVDPARGVDEIVYRATYANLGGTTAGFVRLWVPIPEDTEYVRSTQFRTETHYKKKKRPGKKPVKVPYTVRVPYVVESTRILQGDDDLAIRPVVSLLGGGRWLTCLVPNVDPYPNPGYAKTLEFRVKLKPGVSVGTRIEQEGLFVTSRELFHWHGIPDTLAAEVVPPAHLSYEFDESISITQDEDGNPTGIGELIHRAIYSNSGGVAATGIRLRYEIPRGFKFRDARFTDTTGAVVRTSGVTKPAPGAGSGEVVFDLGSVAVNTAGIAEVRLDYDLASLPNATNEPNLFRRFQSSTQFLVEDTNPANSEDGAVEKSEEVLLANSFSVSGVVPNSARSFVGVIGPAAAAPGEEITYRILVGNHSNSGRNGGGFLYIRIPTGTQYVRSEIAGEDGGTIQLTNLRTEPGQGTAAQYGIENPNGIISHGIGLGPNSVVAIDFTVRIDSDRVEDLNMLGPVFLHGQEGGSKTCPTLFTSIADTDVELEQLRQGVFKSQLGGSEAKALGTADNPEEYYLDARNAVGRESIAMAFGGADIATIPGHNIALIPLGGGRMVAAGAGNLVGPDGGSVIRGSVGAMVAAGAGNIVAAGAGNIVAAGAGNLITVDVPGIGLFSGSDYFSQFPQMVAAGAGNLFNGKGLNFVRKLVGPDGASLIGMDGATLIGLDGVKLAGVSRGLNGVLQFKLPSGEEISATGNRGMIVAAGAGNLNGRTSPLVFAGGGLAGSVDSVNIVESTQIVAAGAGNLGFNPSGAVVPLGEAAMRTQAVRMVAAGAGNLKIAAGGNFITIGGNIVAAGAGN